MNDSAKTTPRKPDVPEEIKVRWQRIVDLMARTLNVPAGLIMRVDPPQIEVFLSSATAKNPFHKGERVDLLGLYCERVMNQRSPLLVPDAAKDPEWERSVGVKLGMTFYLGYPLTWPDGEIFGTICALDEKDNPHATQFRGLISEFQEVVERDLGLIVETHERENLLAEIQRHRDHLREMVAEQTAELEKSKEMLEERLRFEDLVSDLSAKFVNVPPDRVEDEIVRALNRICQFFGVDHCGLLEVLGDLGQARFVDSTDKEERLRKGLSVDVVPNHPWGNYQLIEKGEPIIFSSLEALPPEASVDRAAWEQEGVQAVLMLPLRVGGKVTHLIGLRSCRSREPTKASPAISKPSQPDIETAPGCECRPKVNSDLCSCGPLKQVFSPVLGPLLSPRKSSQGDHDGAEVLFLEDSIRRRLPNRSKIE